MMDRSKTCPQNNLFKLSAILILLILALGTWARFKELEWHFTSVDDRGVAEIIFKNRAAAKPEMFPIPSFYTYAPLQFLITPLLISEKQSYRDLLWWGRFPSAVASSLALIIFVLLYLSLYGKRFHRMLFPLALMAFSWENIIYAKQMHNYAIGVLGSVLLLWLLWINLKNPRFTLSRMVLNAAALAVISHMQYQLLSMIPPFFAVLFAASWIENKDRKQLFLNFLAGGLLYGALVFPMWFFFLRKHMEINAGAPSWAFGKTGEFLLSVDSSLALIDKFKYILRFYVQNFFTVFQADIAFLPETHFLSEPLSFVLFILFALGILNFCTEKDRPKKLFNFYVLLVLLSWLGLVFMKKLTLSPTRHALIYLPFLAVTIGQGFFHPFEKLKWKEESAGRISAGVLVIFMVTFFGLNYGKFLIERRDPFSEEKILDVLNKYPVDAIGTNVRTDGLSMMPRIEAFKKKIERERAGRNQTMAWISRWDVSFNRDNCDETRAMYNQMQMKASRETGTPHSLIEHPCSDYKVLYSERRPSDLQVDYSRKTQVNIYTNSFYFYVVSRDPEVIKKAGV